MTGLTLVYSEEQIAHWLTHIHMVWKDEMDDLRQTCSSMLQTSIALECPRRSVSQLVVFVLIFRILVDSSAIIVLLPALLVCVKEAVHGEACVYRAAQRRVRCSARQDV